MTRTLARLCVVGAALSLAAPAARAQRVSPMPAGRFMQFCGAPRGQQICDAYITGMADSFALVQKLPGGSGEDARKAGICVPASTNGAAMRGVVVAWIGGHRDMLQKQVGEVVYQALHESYRCGAGGAG